MSYEIEVTELFEKQLKKLAKKYKSLGKDMEKLFKDLSENPHLGVDLGNNTFKIRLAVKSKGKGKSGGLRIIDHVIDSQELIYLLSIYDKSDIESVHTAIIRAYVDDLQKEQ
ncbi:MAG: hypothetical protein EAZ97_00230 [Bacteroidetes bacterium]|nr:MAG: hypothetical protein EAZ97_00230 [Bacteroidota bacterium]